MPKHEETQTVIDTANLPLKQAAAISYALLVREHISEALGQVHRGLAEKDLSPREAKQMSMVLEHVDKNVLRDIATLGGVSVGPNEEIGEAFVMDDNDPKDKPTHQGGTR